MRTTVRRPNVRTVNPQEADLIEEQQATRAASGIDSMGETLYTLDEIAKYLKVSKSTTRRMFAGESGVLVLNSQGHRSTTSGRVRIRVPQSVFDRIINNMEKI